MRNLSATPPAFALAPKVSKEKVLLLPQTNHSATHAVEHPVPQRNRRRTDRFLHQDRSAL